MTSIEVNQYNAMMQVAEQKRANEASEAIKRKQNEITEDYNAKNLELEEKKFQFDQEYKYNMWLNDQARANAAVAQAAAAAAQAKIQDAIFQQRKNNDYYVNESKKLENEAKKAEKQAAYAEQQAQNYSQTIANETAQTVAKQKSTDISAVALATGVVGTVAGAFASAFGRVKSAQINAAAKAAHGGGGKTIIKTTSVLDGHYANYLDGFTPLVMLKPALNAILHAGSAFKTTP